MEGGAPPQRIGDVLSCSTNPSARYFTWVSRCRALLRHPSARVRLPSAGTGDIVHLTGARNASMDRKTRQRRYERKDYDQMVEFPVEIVGRDGVVRRYSFEDSVRLYQRRIASAATRHEDQSVAEAETLHCQRRIDQLRRSYLQRHGGEAVAGIPELEATPGLAGEAVAFLRRRLGEEISLDNVRLEAIGATEGGQILAVHGEGAPTLLLYLFAFSGAEGGPGREGFFRQVRLLEGSQGLGDGVEALIGYHHASDCGIVLTGDAELGRRLAGPRSSPESSPWEAAPSPPGFQTEAMGLVRRGELDEALACLERAFERDPYQRVAYLGACALADQLGRFEAGGMSAAMGAHYFPNDPAIAWHGAVSHLRLGQLDEARFQARRAEDLHADPHSVAVLAALIALVSGRQGEGLRRLRDAANLDQGQDPGLTRSRRRLRMALAIRRAIAMTGLLSLGLAGLLLAQGLAGAAFGALSTGLVVLATTGPAFRYWLVTRISSPGRSRLSLSSIANLGLSARIMRPDQ